MNKSVMKCCICNNENIGQFITINNKKYHLCCIEQLQQENQELKLELSGYRQAILNNKEMLGLKEQNDNLKKQLDKYENPEDITLMMMWCTEKVKDENAELKRQLEGNKNQQKEFIDYLEDEKDRLARECSQIYEDSLGKTRLVNEDVFDEVNRNLQKYQETIGVSE